MVGTNGKSAVARVFNWKTIPLFWILFSVFIASPKLITYRLLPRGATFLQTLYADLLCSAGWIAATPAILLLSRKFFIGGRRWWGHALVHLAACGVFSVLTLSSFTLLYGWVMGGMNLPFRDEIVMLVNQYFSTMVMYYWFVVMIYHALAYLDRHRQEQLVASRMQEKLSDARLQVLTARLQPHFLFNTLHTIGSLVRLDRKEHALDTLSEFGELLRRSLEHGERAFVPLSDELAFIRKYLAIEERRFEDRLRVTYDVRSGVEEIAVPALILQPLIENAVRHGIGKRPGAGRLEIVAFLDAGRLRLEVNDDGPGLPDGWDRDREERFGLRNTRERLEQLYGDGGRLILENRPSGGVSAALVIPTGPAEEGAHT